MSEKTVKKIIGTAEVCPSCFEQSVHYLHYKFSSINDTPVGTKVELVAILPVKRKLIRPQCAEWLMELRDSQLFDGETILAIPNIGWPISMREIHEKRWMWTLHSKTHYANSKEEAKRDAEETLADAGLYGFRWEVNDE